MLVIQFNFSFEPGDSASQATNSVSVDMEELLIDKDNRANHANLFAPWLAAPDVISRRNNGMTVLGGSSILRSRVFVDLVGSLVSKSEFASHLDGSRIIGVTAPICLAAAPFTGLDQKGAGDWCVALPAEWLVGDGANLSQVISDRRGVCFCDDLPLAHQTEPKVAQQKILQAATVELHLGFPFTTLYQLTIERAYRKSVWQALSQTFENIGMWIEVEEFDTLDNWAGFGRKQ